MLNSYLANQFLILAHKFFDQLHDPVDEPTTAPMTDIHQGEDYSLERWKCK